MKNFRNIFIHIHCVRVFVCVFLVCQCTGASEVSKSNMFADEQKNRFSAYQSTMRAMHRTPAASIQLYRSSVFIQNLSNTRALARVCQFAYLSVCVCMSCEIISSPKSMLASRVFLAWQANNSTLNRACAATVVVAPVVLLLLICSSYSSKSVALTEKNGRHTHTNTATGIQTRFT